MRPPGVGPVHHPAPVAAAPLGEDRQCVGHALIVAGTRLAQGVEPAQDVVVPPGRIMQPEELRPNDLTGAVAAEEPVREQQLRGPGPRL
jgi:hypothetical protein